MAIIKIFDQLSPNNIYLGDSRQLLKKIEKESIALSIWSPPYYVGKEYEKDLSFEDWKGLLREVINLHFPIIKPGGFLVINIADILCFKDESMPKIMAENVSRRKIKLTKEDILKVKEKHPDWNWRQCYNPRYWQGTARKIHSVEESEARKTIEFLTNMPEAHGVDWTAMMHSIGIQLNWDWPPKHSIDNLTYRISIGGSLIKECAVMNTENVGNEYF